MITCKFKNLWNFLYSLALNYLEFVALVIHNAGWMFNFQVASNVENMVPDTHTHTESMEIIKN